MAYEVKLDLNYLWTTGGILLSAITILALIGGVVNSFSFGFRAFMGFLFWSTLSISGSFLVTRILGGYPVLEAKYDFFPKLEVGYVVVWTILYFVGFVFSFINFGVSNIIGYVLLVLFLAEGVRRYRISTDQLANPADTAEQA